MKVLDLFAGIGGFTIGLERAGFETVAFCEIDLYAKKVLKKNWPGVPIYDDVRTITAERLASDGIRVDVITGGFPCQDISVAGKQAGIEGERSGLWSECARLIRELQPRYAIFENVTNLLNGERGAWFKRVLWDISALGYDAEWHCIPASELGAHHHRDRVWIVAYPSGGEWEPGAEKQSPLRSLPQDGAIDDNSGGRGAPYESVLAYSNRGDDTRLNGGASERSGQITPKRTEHAGRRGGEQNVADTECVGQSGSGLHGGRVSKASPQNRQASWVVNRCEGRASVWDVEPDVGRVANGVPSRSHRLKCLGNAVVPPIPELIGRALK